MIITEYTLPKTFILYNTYIIYMRRKIILLLLAGSIFSITSCSEVKEYQKSRINDSEMSLSTRNAQKNELNFQSYREGSSGANGGKNGGGCGCN